VEKLWRYTRLSRMWGRTLMAVGVLMLPLGAAIEAGAPDGDVTAWATTALITVVPTTVLFVILLRSWMRQGALPSSRLKDARREGGDRLLEATRADWRKWGAVFAAGLFVGGATMMGFLDGILGGGGMAEGVVSAVLIAWGLVTVEDVRRVEGTERTEGRVYYAACRRPLSVGSTLVWRRTGEGAGPAS
jgi:hypothetical protein